MDKLISLKKYKIGLLMTFVCMYKSDKSFHSLMYHVAAVLSCLSGLLPLNCSL